MNASTALSLALPSVTNAPNAPRAHLGRTSVAGLLAQLEAAEARELPDQVVALADLRMNDDGLVEVPGIGAFGLNDWSRQQLSSEIGVRWDRWFEQITGAERVEEVNRRFARSAKTAKLRLTSIATAEGDGTLRALVSPTYTPVRDTATLRLVADVLSRAGHEVGVYRHEITDRSTTVVLRVGEPFEARGPAKVGDLLGGLALRNSGVGFSCFTVDLHLTRLQCTNGLLLPIAGWDLVHVRHRALDLDRIAAQLTAGCHGLAERLRGGASILAGSGAFEVERVEAEVRSALVAARLPMRLAPGIMQAFEREPVRTRFGVSQAITLAAQAQPAEVRWDMERAAGAYLLAAA